MSDSVRAFGVAEGVEETFTDIVSALCNPVLVDSYDHYAIEHIHAAWLLAEAAPYGTNHKHMGPRLVK